MPLSAPSVPATLRPRLHRYRTLTPRESQILRLLASEGVQNKQIADRLRVSEETIKRHLTNIFNKTGMSTRVELVVGYWYDLYSHLAEQMPSQPAAVGVCRNLSRAAA